MQMSPEERIAALEETVVELRQLVLALRQGLHEWAMRQRESRAVGIGADEDLLGMYYDKSLLARRRDKVKC